MKHVLYSFWGCGMAPDMADLGPSWADEFVLDLIVHGLGLSLAGITGSPQTRAKRYRRIVLVCFGLWAAPGAAELGPQLGMTCFYLFFGVPGWPLFWTGRATGSAEEWRIWAPSWDDKFVLILNVHGSGPSLAGITGSPQHRAKRYGRIVLARFGRWAAPGTADLGPQLGMTFFLFIFLGSQTGRNQWFSVKSCPYVRTYCVGLWDDNWNGRFWHPFGMANLYWI